MSVHEGYVRRADGPAARGDGADCAVLVELLSRAQGVATGAQTEAMQPRHCRRDSSSVVSLHMLDDSGLRREPTVPVVAPFYSATEIAAACPSHRTQESSQP